MRRDPKESKGFGSALRQPVRALVSVKTPPKKPQGSTPRLTPMLWKKLPGWSLPESSIFMFEFDEIKGLCVICASQTQCSRLRPSVLLWKGKFNLTGQLPMSH